MKSLIAIPLGNCFSFAKNCTDLCVHVLWSSILSAFCVRMNDTTALKILVRQRLCECVSASVTRLFMLLDPVNFKIY